MILELLKVIKVANDLIEKNKIDRDVVTGLYQDLSSIDQMIEGHQNSNNTSSDLM